jgi:hypothetical protein
MKLRGVTLYKLIRHNLTKPVCKIRGVILYKLFLNLLSFQFETWIFSIHPPPHAKHYCAWFMNNLVGWPEWIGFDIILDFILGLTNPYKTDCKVTGATRINFFQAFTLFNVLLEFFLILRKQYPPFMQDKHKLIMYSNQC